MLELSLDALALLCTVKGLTFLTAGTLVGLLFGAIPGLGGATALALLIPLTFGMEPRSAMFLIGGVLCSVAFGGSITAILLNTPGMAPNAATVFDGYPMAQQGRAGAAIGAAATASSLGGLLGVVILVAIMPVAEAIVLAFGPPEFFVLALLGLCAIAVSTMGHTLRGLVVAGVGLLLSYVGVDAVSGLPRYTLDYEYLRDGIPVIPALIGLFAISEMIHLSVKGGTVAADREMVRITRIRDGIFAVFKQYPTLLRGSAIGAFIGAVPGLGGTVASFLAYSATVSMSRDKQSFGKGNIQGVIAPESANNAKDGGALIPTLAFGIPGSAEMGVFMGVLIMHGMDPGPMLLIDSKEVIVALILALSVACVLASVIGLACARWLALITLVDVRILVPIVVATAMVGAYALHSSVEDVVVALIFGVLGYLMTRLEYPKLPMVIALILGETAERNLAQALAISDGRWSIFIERPVSLTLIVLTLAFLAFPVVVSALDRRRSR